MRADGARAKAAGSALSDFFHRELHSGSGKILVCAALDWEDRLFRRKEAAMEWVVKLETRNGWGEVETIEVGRLDRRVSGLTAEEVGMMLAEGKNLLGELGRLILQTQMEEFTTRVCGDCLKLRRLSVSGPAKSRLCLGPSVSMHPVSAPAGAGAVRALWMSPCRH